MDKQNVFCSSQFYMAEGDILHILVKDLTGTMPSIELYDTEDNIEDIYGEDAESRLGALYNWYAATDVRYIAANGWRVPTEEDWETLIAYLGGAEAAGGKLKETGTTYWLAPNTGATNESGFNGRCGNYRLDDGTWASDWGEEGMIGTFWTTSEQEDAGFWYAVWYGLFNDPAFIGGGIATNPGAGDDPKNDAATLRLLKETTSLTHGQTSLYQGNDGTIYNTICIGTQEWISENLKETKFRNGDTIPLVSDAVTWNALVETAAMCYYENDIGNA
jgi:uncharacterized protein (TIGR02145 family)